jgi:23S rRNA pseudouridine1911/1915/1917 synthase
MTDNFLGFPPPLLGEQALRLPVVYDDGDLLALAKPFGVVVQQDGWYPRIPSLVEATRYQAMNGKPEFVHLNIGEQGLWAITDLDCECMGPVLFSRSRERAEELKNGVGSGQFSFTYYLLSQAIGSEEEFACELPLARHSRRAHMLVSHTTGKKALTVFKFLGRLSRYGCYEARTDFPRRHQVLVHALESGLPVVGDSIYAGSQPVYLSALKSNYRPRRNHEERPLYPGPAYYLRSIELLNGNRIEADEPRQWVSLFKQLKRYG